MIKQTDSKADNMDDWTYERLKTTVLTPKLKNRAWNVRSMQ